MNNEGKLQWDVVIFFTFLLISLVASITAKIIGYATYSWGVALLPLWCLLASIAAGIIVMEIIMTPKKSFAPTDEEPGWGCTTCRAQYNGEPLHCQKCGTNYAKRPQGETYIVTLPERDNL